MEQLTTGGFSEKRLTRVRDVLQRHVDAGFAPGALTVVARRGDVRVAAVGTHAFEGPGASTPMASDTVWRTGSMTKPIVAACAMTFVEDGTLRLDDPVDDYLPELADMTVLADPNGPLDDVVPAHRAITLRDLLTFRLGTGMLVAEPGTVPIADALDALEDGQLPGGPDALTRDAWLARLGALPLVCQPGERWLYDLGSNVLGALLERVTGASFGQTVQERVCEPLGMPDTGFEARDLSRIASAYRYDSAAGKPVLDDPPDGRWSRPPIYEDGGGGIVSTADDYLAFATALLTGGGDALSRPSVALMTMDHLTPEQRLTSGFGPTYLDEFGWGFGMGVRTRRTHVGPSVGTYGWPGFYGTAWYTDPVEELTVLVVRQVNGTPVPFVQDVLTAAYQAIED